MESLNPSQEILGYFERIDQKMSYINDLRYEIGCLINNLESVDADLLDCFMKFESAKDICKHSLSGEPVAIWAELQRLGF